MKKIIITVFAASSLLLYSTPSFALLNFSVGVPLSHSFADTKVAESEGVSGYFIQIGVPMLPGLGMDSYETKLKCTGCSKVPKLSTSMYNLYYLLPIPIINLTIGLGTGKTEYSYGGVAIDDGAATQWYTSFGIPIIPLFDLHLSYRSISSKIEWTTGSDKGTKSDFGGSVMGLGIGFNF
ncbi:uncharacterized protein METZ01_LOCUS203062 [marine metagenome]|uniref:Outer membrane protein beta-barrel domain-containing protein n=1 Tax=marine metagenome TaxID=408172 RepID=A0A382EHJ1_9ZZZZ